MKKIYQNYFYNLAYHIFSIIVPLITTPYLSRVLGASGLGDYAFAYSVASYFSLFIVLGLKSYGNREIAIAREDREDVSNKFWNIYGMQAVIGIVISAIYFIYASFKNDNVLALVFSLFVISSMLDISWFFFGQEAFKTVSIRDFVVKILTVTLIFVYVRSPADVWKYALIYSLGTVISQILLWLSVRKYVDFVKPSLAEIKKHMLPNLILFIPIVSVHMYKTIDKIMLGIMAESQEVGFYYSAEKVVGVPLTIVTSLNTVMLPHMSFLYAKKQGMVADEKLVKSLHFCVLCSTGISISLMSVANLFVPLFYGNGYEKCIELFWFLLPCGIIVSYTNVICHQYLIPNNIRKAYVSARLVGAVANVLLNALLITQYGAVGAAIATLITELVVLFVQMSFARKEISFWHISKGTYIYLIAGVIALVIFNNIKFDFSYKTVELCLKSFLCLVLYGLIAFVWLFVFRRGKRNEKAYKKSNTADC